MTVRTYKALDLFCGAGGATKGLQRAGFHVTGIDNRDQPRYCGDVFIQGDAMEADLTGYDLVWASPPCQAYSSLRGLGKQAHVSHPKLIEPIRDLLLKSGIPYVIENVPGAPLIDPVVLCGHYFGLGVRRHRLFECSFPVNQPNCSPFHRPNSIAVYGDHPEHHSRNPGKGYINRAHTLEMGQAAMGIDWMTWRELTQAIPPAYSEFLGKQAMAAFTGLNIPGKTRKFWNVTRTR